VHVGQRLERPANRERGPPRALGHAALLAAIAGQEDDDAIGFPSLYVRSTSASAV
jgi:hypothetical protein